MSNVVKFTRPAGNPSRSGPAASRAATAKKTPLSGASSDNAIPGGPLNGIHVLIVEDEDDAREMIAIVLTHEGAAVSSAGSAAEAFALLRARASDAPLVIVSDLSMPGEDGFALIRRIRTWEDRASGRPRRIPAIALSALDQPEAVARALHSGFNSHLVKPIDAERLRTTISRLARTGPTLVSGPSLRPPHPAAPRRG